MPFITEELWHELRPRQEDECIIVAPYPQPGSRDEGILEEGVFAFAVVTEIRNTRNAKNLSPKEALALLVRTAERRPLRFAPVIEKLANLKEIEFVKDAPGGTVTGFMVGSTEFFIPLEGKVDVEKEREAIVKEIGYHNGLLAMVEKKHGKEKLMKS
jgi:valyl-tRNA synthetase